MEVFGMQRNDEWRGEGNFLIISRLNANLVEKTLTFSLNQSHVKTIKGNHYSIWQ